jgi:hypothetical protein
MQQREERLYGGVVGARPDPTHRSDEPVAAQQADEVARSELPAPVGVHDDPDERRSSIALVTAVWIEGSHQACGAVSPARA